MNSDTWPILGAVVLLLGSMFVIWRFKQAGYDVAGSTNIVIAKNYYVFSQKDYDQALKSDKLIFLDFYAAWCPICRSEEPDLKAGFNKLNSDSVIGFRVNYDSEKDLVAKLYVPHQHYKVVIRDEKILLKSGDAWSTDTFVAQLSKFLE